MSEYIEREAVLAQTHEIIIKEVGYRHRCIDPQAIKEIPAADVAPVRRGHWIICKSYNPAFKGFECSECGAQFQGYRPDNYCGNCGAKMEDV